MKQKTCPSTSKIIRTIRNLKGMTYLSMLDIFNVWQQEREKLWNDWITKEDYDAWRYIFLAGEALYKSTVSGVEPVVEGNNQEEA